MKKQLRNTKPIVTIDGKLTKKSKKRAAADFKNIFTNVFFRKNIIIDSKGRFCFEREFCNKNSITVLINTATKN